MSGTTPTYAFPYPTASDVPAGHTQMQALATAVDTQLALTDANVTANASATQIISDIPITANSGNTSGTAKTIWVSRTVTLISGRRYKVTFDTGYDTAAVSTVIFEMHYIAGAVATLTGATKFYGRYQRSQTGGAFLPAIGSGIFTAPSSGQYTVMGALWNSDSSVSKTNGGTPNSTDNNGKFVIELA